MNPSFAVHRMNFLIVFSLAVITDKAFATVLEIDVLLQHYALFWE